MSRVVEHITVAQLINLVYACIEHREWRDLRRIEGITISDDGGVLVTTSTTTHYLYQVQQ